MAVFEVDELAFEVPDGYLDRTINIFTPPPSQMRAIPLGIVITREPRTDEQLEQQVSKLLKTLSAQMPGGKILGQRARTVGALSGRECRMHLMRDGVPLYQRHFLVHYYDLLLSVIVTSTRSQSARCESLMEQLLLTLRLRKR